MASTQASSELSPLQAINVSGGGAAQVSHLPLARRERVEQATGRPFDERGRVLRRLLLSADIAALFVAFGLETQILGSFHSTELLLLCLSVPLWVLLGNGHRLYHLDSHRADYRASDELGPVLQMATVGSWGALLVLAALHPGDTPIAGVALFWALTAVLLMSFRSLVRGYARRRSWYKQHALVIGPASQAAAIVRKLERHPEWGIRATTQPDPTDLEWADRNAQLVALAALLDVDRVMLTPAVSDSLERAELVCALSELGVHVDLIPGWSDVVGARLDVQEMEGMPLLTVPSARLRRSSLRLKRTLDICLTGIALILLAPVMAIIAIAIKLDSPGPVLFRQRRVGKHDRAFEVFKFRSMCVDADARKEEIAALSFHGGGNEAGMFKVRDDPRITRVGRVLRRSSLDELPQLFNILSGDMSLVGPRPLIENEDRQVEGRHRRRVTLTPGLTGLWQAHGRSEIPFEEMVNLDYLYVTNWSLWGDVKLLMRTASAVLRGGGAY